MDDSKNNTFTKPAGTDLSNWRLAPYSAWAFQNVRELIPTAPINAAADSIEFPADSSDLITNLDCTALGIKDLPAFLERSHTDSIVVVKKGAKRWQWQAPHCDVSKPHIVFSISKSITAMLAGILVNQKLIDVGQTVSYYLPGTQGSAYEDASVQQLLDMTVALDFDESYLDATGDYQRYRNATCWNPIDQTDPGPGLEEFLYAIDKLDDDHGQQFRYRSPNSDLLGLLVERVAGLPYAQLLSSLIWQPMGAHTDGYVTVDRNTLARGAGGICITLDDLARFGDLMLNKGSVNTLSVIPESWIDDTLNKGNRDAWLKGDFSVLLPQGCYRNKWYQIGNRDNCFMAIGIHGQWLYINPVTSVVIVKFSSQPEPVSDQLDLKWLELLSLMSAEA